MKIISMLADDKYALHLSLMKGIGGNISVQQDEDQQALADALLDEFKTNPAATHIMVANDKELVLLEKVLAYMTADWAGDCNLKPKFSLSEWFKATEIRKQFNPAL